MNTKDYKDIVVIHNPNSKQNMRDKHKKRKLEHIVGSYATIKTTSSPEEVSLIAERCKRFNVSNVAFDGGDGTIQRGVTIFNKIYEKEKMPCIVPLRGGTANILANTVGLKGNYKSILESLIDHYSTNKRIGRVNRQILEVDTDNGKNCGFLFANGIVYNFYRPAGLGYNYRFTGTPSAWKAVKLTAKGIYGVLVNNSTSEKVFDFPEISVDIEGKSYSGKMSMFATALQSTRVVFVPVNRSTREGTMQIYGTSRTGRGALEVVARMLIGGSLDIKDCIDQQAQQMIIKSKNPDEPWGYILEGEEYTCKTATIKPGRMIEFPVLD